MKTLTPLLAAACLGLAVSGARAQISSFPAPPSLQQSTTQTANNTSASSSPLAPPSDSAAQAGKTDSATAPKSTSPTQLSAATLTSMSALDDKTNLEPGDTVSFRVIEDRDDPVTRVVTDTGEVDFPYIGRVKVAGKTCHQVAIEVKKLLEVDYYKHATVILGLDLIIGQDKTKARDMVWVVGEVRDVGPQELIKAQPMTVSQIILRAGGFGDFADQRRVKIIHRPNTADSSQPLDVSKVKDAQVIDVKSVFDGKSMADPVVKPGDYVIVPKRFINY